MTNKKCEGIDCAWCMSIECPREKDTTMTDKEKITDLALGLFCLYDKECVDNERSIN